MSIFNNLNTAIIGAFGKTVTYKKTGYADVELAAVPEDQEMLTEATNPSYLHLFIGMDQFTDFTPAKGDRVVKSGVHYNVVDVKVDQENGCTLTLQKRVGA
jgi:hypothetical protein